MKITPFEASKRWKFIKEQVNKIIDPVLKESVLAEYKERAIDEWGFCPDSTEYKSQKVELEQWQVDFLKKVKSSAEYGVWVSDKNLDKQIRACIREDIGKGIKFSDYPKQFQNETIWNMYIEVLMEEIKVCEDRLKELG